MFISLLKSTTYSDVLFTNYVNSVQISFQLKNFLPGKQGGNMESLVS